MQIQAQTGLEEDGRNTDYTHTALPFTVLWGAGLRAGPSGGGWGLRGASAEFPLTLMCSQPP